MTDEQIKQIWSGVPVSDDIVAQVTEFARALLSASAADTAGAKAIYQVRPRNGEEWADVSESEYHISGGAGYLQRIVFAAPPAPSVADALPRFDDPRVQTVYELICDGREPPKGEHWDGFVARRIVAALFKESSVADAAGARITYEQMAWRKFTDEANATMDKADARIAEPERKP